MESSLGEDEGSEGRKRLTANQGDRKGSRNWILEEELLLREMKNELFGAEDEGCYTLSRGR